MAVGTATSIAKPATNNCRKTLKHFVPLLEAYTEEEAEQWIAEYEEAMSEVPKADNGQ